MLDITELSAVPPRADQLEGIHLLVKDRDVAAGRVYPGCFALFDEPGFGKTRQVIDAAQVWRSRGHVKKVFVLCINKVRPHWSNSDPVFGEIAKYRWSTSRFKVIEYRGERSTSWVQGPPGADILTFVVTNYEMFRVPRHFDFLLRHHTGDDVLLVVDESSNIGNWNAKQTKRTIEFRKRCGRIVILNGTPETSAEGIKTELDDEELSPGAAGNIFSQAFALHPGILGFRSYSQFKARHAVLGGFRNKQIVGWRYLEDIQEKLAPYVLRRLKHGLPERLPSVTYSVPLSAESWRYYKSMRDDLVVWLKSARSSEAAQAGVKVMRLAQITSGFLGGIQQFADCYACRGEGLPDCDHCGGAGVAPSRDRLVEAVGREKLDVALGTVDEILREKADAKIVLWCRFVFESHRLAEALRQKFPDMHHGMIIGGQKESEREIPLRLLKPATSPHGAVEVVCTLGSGSVGLDFAAGSHVVRVSHGNSLYHYLQAEERVHRWGQKNHVWSCDLVATGPDGQRTIDHTLLKAMRAKKNAAEWTAAAWVKELEEERDGESGDGSSVQQDGQESQG